MSRVCSETCRPPFLSFTFFFILVKRIFRFVSFFNNVHFFLFFSFSILIFFCHSHLETENRGSRAPCQSSVVEKHRETKAGQMMRHDTRHLDWSFIYIQFLYGSFLKFSTMHWKNCEYFILHFEYSESLWKFIYFEKFNFSLNISNSISGFLKN